MKKYFPLIGVLLFVPFFAGAVYITSPTKMNTLYDLFNAVKGFSLVIVLPLAVIILLIAAFFILRAGGNTEALARGKKILMCGLGGLVVVILGAGSSAFLMNTFGIKDMPGITSYLPFDESLKTMDKYLENSKKIKDPTLKTLSSIKEQIDSCSFNGNK